MTLPAGIIKTNNPDGSATYDLGSLFDGTAPFQVGPYVDNGISVPAHYWHSRWVYRPGPIIVKRTPAQLVAAKVMFPYGDMGVPYGTVTAKPYTVMGPSSVTIYMPTTGERPDIGLITDWAAWFMLKGDPGPMLEIAKANDSFPVFFRDETTGKPIDVLKYPQANCYGSPGQGSPWFPPYPTSGVGGGLQPQQAHYPEFAYIAYMATQDLCFLEAVQANATYTIICDAAKSTPTKAIISGEYRGIGWAFRNVFMAHAASQDAESRGELPDTCHPSSYWKIILDNQLAYYTKFMADPANQVFRLVFGIGGIFTPWQIDYFLMALSFGVLTGHADWIPMYLWALKNVIDRGVGTRGYPLGMGGGPYFDSNQPSWSAAFDNLYATTTDPRFTKAQHDALVVDPFNNWHTIYDLSYHLNTRAVLVMAQHLHNLGIIDVKAVYPELDICAANLDHFVKNGGYMTPRASVVFTPVNPPIGELMPTTFSIAVGATEQLNLVLNGALTDGPIYTTDAPTIVSLEPNAAGVIVTGLAVGSAKITATGTGATELSAESDATVTLPLATTMELVPA